jgi:formylglycine-generating enzyme required for sulfatase activity
VHQVKLNYRFAIGQNEVTEAQFRFFLKRTGYNAGPSHLTPSVPLNLPALEVDWYAASAYARWLSRHTGQRYRLPSEAEWDYAAHGGKSTRYWWGDAVADACGKEQQLSTFFRYDQPCAATKAQEIVEVASLSANPWGLYDMMGNAGEWMLDCPPLDKVYADAPVDGSPYMDKNGLLCVMRGPGFLSDPAPRRLVDPKERTINTGFRVLRELP